MNDGNIVVPGGKPDADWRVSQQSKGQFQATRLPQVYTFVSHVERIADSGDSFVFRIFIAQQFAPSIQRLNITCDEQHAGLAGFIGWGFTVQAA